MASKRGRKKARKKKREIGRTQSQWSPPPPVAPSLLSPSAGEEPSKNGAWKAMSHWVRPLRWALTLLGILGGGLTLLAAYPWIELQKDESLAANNPYQTMILAVNDGLFPVNHILVECHSTAAGNKFQIGDAAMTMPVSGTYGHGQKFTLPCIDLINNMPRQNGFSAFVLPLGSKFNRAELKVTIHCSFLWILHSSQKFLLTGITADDGTLHWQWSKP
jgi:hypothetical protein